MTDTQFDYEALSQSAMLGLVRHVMETVAEEGLEGEHHFYITFKTRVEGVRLAPNLVAKHPDEMTIVLQHQFRNLKTSPDGFSVELSFNQTPETLHIPYAALVSFYDPHAEFGLRFAPMPTLEEPASIEQVPTETPRTGSSDNIVSIDSFREK